MQPLPQNSTSGEAPAWSEVIFVMDVQETLKIVQDGLEKGDVTIISILVAVAVVLLTICEYIVRFSCQNMTFYISWCCD